MSDLAVGINRDADLWSLADFSELIGERIPEQ